MAEQYGVRVKASKISQGNWPTREPRQSVAASPIAWNSSKTITENIRGRSDVFVSIGMLEHVGTENYRALGEVIQNTVGNSGRGLLHFIGMNRPRPLSAWIRKRIFPGANPPTLSQMMPPLFEPGDYSVLDVENLRLHYAQTLRHWRNRFERSTDRVAQMFGEQLVRLWRLASQVRRQVLSRARFNCSSFSLPDQNAARFRGPARTSTKNSRKTPSRKQNGCMQRLDRRRRAGRLLRWQLRRSGVDVAILDKSTFPRNKVCGGWITLPVFDELEIDATDYAHNAKFFSPSPDFAQA